MDMRQDRKNSHTGTGQICTKLRTKKRECHLISREKKMWQPYSWDEQRVRMDERSDMIQEGIKKGSSDFWIPRECLQVKKERDYNGFCDYGRAEL